MNFEKRLKKKERIMNQIQYGLTSKAFFVAYIHGLSNLIINHKF